MSVECILPRVYLFSVSLSGGGLYMIPFGSLKVKKQLFNIEHRTKTTQQQQN